MTIPGIVAIAKTPSANFFGSEEIDPFILSQTQANAIPKING